MKFMPVPTSIMCKKLNALSNGLGWGDLDGRAKLFDDGSAPAFYWCSESIGDMTLDIHAIQPAMSNAEVAERKPSFRSLEVHAVSSRYRVYAGPVSFSMPTFAEIPNLVHVLSPLLHTSNFSTAKCRIDLFKRFPTARVPKNRPPLWKPTEMEIIDGNVVVDKARQRYWKRRFAQIARSASSSK
jgi:hypothetical protein